jgi:heme/copper-type cytochrome/quinol oxidase subunit 2
MKTTLATLLALTALFWPQALFACAACFGQTDDKMAQGMNAGIITLLIIITLVLAGVAAFFIHVARRAARQSSFPASPAPSKT